MNRQHLILPLAALVLATAVTTASLAAKTPIAKPKPKVKSNDTKLGTIGTSQLPGEWCDFGKTYTLGKNFPLNLTLKSAEYTLRSSRTDLTYVLPRRGEKLLVLHFTLQNPNPREGHVGRVSIDWTAVSAKSQDTVQGFVGIDGTGDRLEQGLKPGQKVECFAIIPVDCQGEVPKLMAAAHGDRAAPVARYDLRAKVKPLAAGYADPNDKTGATLLQEIPAVLGQSYPSGFWDVKVDSIEFRAEPFATEKLKKNEVYVVATLEYTNGTARPGSVAGNRIVLVDADGVRYNARNGTLSASSDRRIQVQTNGGETAKFRLAYLVPRGIGLKSLTISDDAAWSLAFDLSAYKTP